MRPELIRLARESVQREKPLPLPPQSYLVLMAPRSGSNLLCSQLQKIRFGNPIEAFHFNHDNIRKEYGWEIDFSDPYSYIKQVLEFQTVDGVFGMKLNWNQFETFLELARRLISPMDFELSDAEVVEVFFSGVSYIHIKRKKKVYQAISFSKGQQTGIWKLPKNQDNTYKQYVMRAQYNRDHIEACFDKLLAIDFSWDRYLESHGLQAFDIWYDDLASEYHNTMTKLYDYLEIRAHDVPAPQLKKQANRESQEWASRFIEETPWVKQKNIQNALERGDLNTILSYRFAQIANDRAEQQWRLIPGNRFRPIRKQLFRLQRKARNIFK